MLQNINQGGINIFLYLFGEKSKTRILELLANHMEYGYKMLDISKFTGLSRSTTIRVVKFLLKNELITISESKIYKLNTQSKVVKKMMNLDFEIGKMMSDLVSNQEIKDLQKLLG